MQNFNLDLSRVNNSFMTDEFSRNLSSMFESLRETLRSFSETLTEIIELTDFRSMFRRVREILRALALYLSAIIANTYISAESNLIPNLPTFNFTAQPNAPPIELSTKVISGTTLLNYMTIGIMVTFFAVTIWIYLTDESSRIVVNNIFKDMWNKFKILSIPAATRVLEAIFDTEVGNIWNKITRKDTE